MYGKHVEPMPGIAALTEPEVGDVRNAVAEPTTPITVSSVAQGGGGEDFKAVTPGSAKRSEFTITIDRSVAGRRLGVDVDHADNRTLLVDNVGPGVVEDWNNQHSAELQVRKGDRIIEVNGVKEDINKMIAECKVEGVVKMLVRREGI